MERNYSRLEKIVAFDSSALPALPCVTQHPSLIPNKQQGIKLIIPVTIIIIPNATVFCRIVT